MLSALLNIPGVKGEAKDAKYPEWIELDGWSFGQNQSGTSAYGTGSAAGRVTMDDFTFTKHFDKSSVKLFELCAAGQFIDNAILLVRRSGAKSGQLEDYFKIEFKGLIISSYQTSGSAGDSGLPSESISFNFVEHKNTFFVQKDGAPAGQVMAGYNVKTGVAS
jgi:type VI secretion system Hcp family effector